MKKGLAAGIIFLFIGIAIIPSSGQNIEKPSSPVSRGNTLYVGGSGPGNYTTIQDAIDNASNGDTIFVYNGTYHENVLVTKSLTIIGENKIGTIIDGNGREIGINITATFVTIIGFTIENTKMAGIRVNANNSTISENIIKDFSNDGIWFDFCDAHTASNNILMSGLAIGIDLLFSNHNVITNNTILLTIGGGGISLYTSSNNTVCVGT
jgi:nitrous oxidase accessory protein